jgi:superfamily I DNA and/or RNA helicase
VAFSIGVHQLKYIKIWNEKKEAADDSIWGWEETKKKSNLLETICEVQGEQAKAEKVFNDEGGRLSIIHPPFPNLITELHNTKTSKMFEDLCSHEGVLPKRPAT